MQDINALFRNATNLYQQGQLAQADALYRRILGLAPSYSPALNMLGILSAQSGKPHEALDCFRKASEAAPQDPAPLENLGRILSGLKRFTEATDTYRRALQLKPDSYPALFGLGAALHANRLYADALTSFEEARALNASDPSLHLYMGAASQQLEQNEAAQAHYRQALDLAPDSIDANACMANLLLLQQDFSTAEKYFARAIELGAQRSDIEFGIAQAQEHRGDEMAAREHYIRACELDPKSQNAYIQLDQFLLKSGGIRKSELLARLSSDYVYKDWQESTSDLRKLAALYDYPYEGAVRALQAFIDDYDPGELHHRDWWIKHLDAFGGPHNTHDKLLRSLHSAVYCWSLPDRETLQQIAAFVSATRLCSYGAGSGAWECLLQQHFGTEVVASDFHLRHRFMDMTRVDYSSTRISTSDSIFLAWIVRGDTGVMNILRQMQPGQKLVLVGEPPDREGIPRICGTDEMWDYLSVHFALERTLPLVNYSLFNDNASLFTRKTADSPAS
jgi:Flp pilus assembly protein TadD